jgi:hypothetical protein
VAQSVGSSASLGLPCAFALVVTSCLLTGLVGSSGFVSTCSSLLFSAFGHVVGPAKFLLIHGRVVLCFPLDKIHI